MTRWAAFAGITVAVLALLLVLARASQSIVTGPDVPGAATDSPPAGAAGADDTRGSTAASDGAPADDGVATGDGLSSDDGVATGDGQSSEAAPAPGDGAAPDDGPTDSTAHRRPGGSRFARYGPGSPEPSDPSPRLLLVNVALSQGLLAAVLLGGIWYAEVPPGALGLAPGASGRQVAVGVGFGLALAAANTAGAALAGALGFDPSEELRELLAPDSAAGWALLLLVVLPTIAGFEELLFRGALVGGFAAGFGLSPWLLAVLSSAAFAVGHGAQGPAGVAVTGLLGVVLAAGFVLTGSLLVVLVAHYLVNAVEFVLYEGLDVGPS